MSQLYLSPLLSRVVPAYIPKAEEGPEGGIIKRLLLWLEEKFGCGIGNPKAYEFLRILAAA